MKNKRPQKYNRVSSHQKFMLKRLVLFEGMSVKQASNFLEINYSTAKSIMFNARKKGQKLGKNFSASFSGYTLQARCYAEIIAVANQKTVNKIEIVCTTGNKIQKQETQYICKAQE